MHPDTPESTNVDSETNCQRVAELLENLGAKPEQAYVMAAQLIKRAKQKAAETGKSEVEELGELLAEIARIRAGG